jgi:hypothetical protein
MSCEEISTVRFAVLVQGRSFGLGMEVHRAPGGRRELPVHPCAAGHSTAAAERGAGLGWPGPADRRPAG